MISSCHAHFQMQEMLGCAKRDGSDTAKAPRENNLRTLSPRKNGRSRSERRQSELTQRLNQVRFLLAHIANMGPVPLHGSSPASRATTSNTPSSARCLPNRDFFFLKENRHKPTQSVERPRLNAGDLL
jgi:hypothetical protein